MADGMTIKSNTQAVRRRFEKRINKLDKNTGNSVRMAAKFGKTLMFRLAPRDKGATAKAIVFAKGKAPRYA